MNFFKNYFSTSLFLILALVLYSYSDFHRDFMTRELSLDVIDTQIQTIEIFYFLFYSYIILLIPYYIYLPNKSKARLAIKYIYDILRGKPERKEEESIALRAWVVKLFFIPLMVTWLIEHIVTITNNLFRSYSDIALVGSDLFLFFNTHFFWGALSLILFIDVLFFTLWYLIEAPFLKNTIKSVEPTLIGWAACILCYPPFNNSITNIVGWYSSDFPTFNNPLIHVWLNILILILMGIYSWASLSLGLKASNLTNRGIVKKWPYKYIRHPAYICKNTAWLIGGFPLMGVVLLSGNIAWFFTVSIWLITWSFIYYLRAMTEEAHLSLDPDYIQYKREVPYRFIPRIW